ncbi:hypothetical protein PM082_018401 [Marasmius tenuissimus]|nr:hypothetical protein PM082_018401 [Marasmius tenuissimus]
MTDLEEFEFEFIYIGDAIALSEGNSRTQLSTSSLYPRPLPPDHPTTPSRNNPEMEAGLKTCKGKLDKSTYE